MENKQKIDKFGYYLDEISKERAVYGTFDVTLVYHYQSNEKPTIFIIPFKRHGLLYNIRKYKEIEQAIKNKNIVETLAYLINSTDYVNINIFKHQIGNIPPRLLIDDNAINEFISLIETSHPEYVVELKQRIMNDRKYIVENTNFIQQQKCRESFKNKHPENSKNIV